MAAEIAQDVRPAEGPSNAHLKPQATEACTRQAAQYGSVYIVDVEQRLTNRIIVWGSVTDARQQRRTFECHYTTRLARFQLRDIAPAR